MRMKINLNKFLPCLLLAMFITTTVKAELYSGLEFIGTSHQKLDGASFTQDGLGLGIRAGAGFAFIPPLDLHLRLQSSFSTVAYDHNGTKRRVSILDFAAQLDWRPGAVTLGFPIGFALITPAGRKEEAGPMFGIYSSINDLDMLEPWIEFKWSSISNDHRYLLASFGVNWKW
jgi:hypothetical protein